MSDRYWLWHDINDRSCTYYVMDRHVSSIGDSDPRNVVAVCTDDQQAQRIVDLLNFGLIFRGPKTAPSPPWPEPGATRRRPLGDGWHLEETILGSVTIRSDTE